MALDFPSSPTVGQQFTSTAGATFVWNGSKWTRSGGWQLISQQTDFSTAGHVVWFPQPYRWFRWTVTQLTPSPTAFVQYFYVSYDNGASWNAQNMFAGVHASASGGSSYGTNYPANPALGLIQMTSTVQPSNALGIIEADINPGGPVDQHGGVMIKTGSYGAGPANMTVVCAYFSLRQRATGAHISSGGLNHYVRSSTLLGFF